MKFQINTKKLSNSRKELFFSELHSFFSSGLDFTRSFQLIIDTEKDAKTKNILGVIYNEVVNGAPLWQSMKICGNFTQLDHGVIRIGEETGKIIDSLKFLSEYYHKKIDQKRIITSSVSYPVIILITALVVVTFMLIVIVPMFEQVYSRMGGELPQLTKTIINFSSRFPKYALWGLMFFIVGYFLLYLGRENVMLKDLKSKFLLNIPLLGNIIRKNHQAHFCKLLFLLTSSGIPLLSGIKMVSEIISFYPYQSSFKDICIGLEKGEYLTENLDRYPSLYDSKLRAIIRVGEETNSLGEMFYKQSEDLTQELEYNLKQLGHFLEPFLIMFVGILVAVILISMYLPMFKLGGITG